jgi:hypothetical protein
MGRLSITYFPQKKEGDSSFKKATLRSWSDSAIRTAVNIFGICWKKFSTNSMTEKIENLKCPFCWNQRIEPAVGKTSCAFYGASFKIDDRPVCVFGNTDELRLPAVGTICAHCGLIHADEHHNCLYCGVGISSTVQ